MEERKWVRTWAGTAGRVDEHAGDDDDGAVLAPSCAAARRCAMAGGGGARAAAFCRKEEERLAGGGVGFMPVGIHIWTECCFVIRIVLLLI